MRLRRPKLCFNIWSTHRPGRLLQLQLRISEAIPKAIYTHTAPAAIFEQQTCDETRNPCSHFEIESPPLAEKRERFACQHENVLIPGQT